MCVAIDTCCRLEVNAFGLGEHGGTHIDAPSHFVKDHWRVHQIPASHLVGPGVVVDVEDKVKANADYEMTKEDLLVGRTGEKIIAGIAQWLERRARD